MTCYVHYREILSLDDGGEVGLDWGVLGNTSSASPEVLAKDTPVMLILPGITGNSMDNYILHLVEDGLQQGYRPVVFNHRGTGGIKLKVSLKHSTISWSDYLNFRLFVPSVLQRWMISHRLSAMYGQCILRQL